MLGFITEVVTRGLVGAAARTAAPTAVPPIVAAYLSSGGNQKAPSGALAGVVIEALNALSSKVDKTFGGVQWGDPVVPIAHDKEMPTVKQLCGAVSERVDKTFGGVQWGDLVVPSSQEKRGR